MKKVVRKMLTSDGNEGMMLSTKPFGHQFGMGSKERMKN